MREPPSLEEFRAIQKKYPVDPRDVRAMLSRVPPSWEKIDMTTAHMALADDGAAFRRGGIQVIISLGFYPEKGLWIHVSMCGRTGVTRFHLPDWEDVKRVKHDFIGPDRWAYQIFPPEADYINQNQYVLHLFAQFDGKAALPDFTRGMGVI